MKHYNPSIATPDLESRESEGKKTGLSHHVIVTIMSYRGLFQARPKLHAKHITNHPPPPSIALEFYNFLPKLPQTTKRLDSTLYDC